MLSSLSSDKCEKLTVYHHISACSANTTHCTKAQINLPVKLNKDDDFYGIVTFLPKFSIMTSYLGIVISVCWIFCAN